MKPNNCKTRVNTADRTDTGNVRKSNQDVGLNMTTPRAPLNADALLAVADGMGGHASGELASRMAIEELVNCLNSSSKSKSSVARMLENAVKHANSAVHKAGMAPAHMGMGTTLTVAIIAKFNLYVANVGDSRCYLLRGNCLRQVTQDHSYVAEQVLAGNLTEEEARQHPARNMITRAIGLESRVEVDVFPPIPLRKGDRVLICSDGLYSMVRDTEIMNILRRHKPELACKKLVELANAN
ncbi:MAG: Stp1/IreP family PP2C-type Ser/Thr phosphatase, partial [Gammaproteobacteria bacterium]|nr:Stp1/IreP family PP2C-type Ser/Thr phosphatase [Gammaproteobacteria bacterium]